MGKEDTSLVAIDVYNHEFETLHCLKDHWIRTEKCSVFIRIKTCIAINVNTSLNTDEYGALFSLYSVVFYAVLENICERDKRRHAIYRRITSLSANDMFSFLPRAIRNAPWVAGLWGWGFIFIHVFEIDIKGFDKSTCSQSSNLQKHVKSHL